MLHSMPRSARLPLQALPAFLEAARRQNLRVAAEAMHLTPSAVSQQLRGLEAQLGFALFERRGRRLVLNAAGEAMRAAVEAALARLDEGRQAAEALSGAGEALQLRLTLLPSFAQRWLLPRMARWRAAQPGVGLELHTSQAVVDLEREGLHAALRQGAGRWRGLVAERLIDSPLVAVGTPAAAARVAGRLDAIEHEPLLGDPELWRRYFAAGGRRAAPRPMANFNDAGLMLDAAERGIGVALGREVLVADALREGRLARLTPLVLLDERAYAYWFVYPPALASWAPIVALRTFLAAEFAASLRAIKAPARGSAASRPTGSRSRAASARSTPRRPPRAGG
jgi:LysR family glycine cleavage system transcriptional activator